MGVCNTFWNSTQICFQWVYFRTKSRKLGHFIDTEHFCHHVCWAASHEGSDLACSCYRAKHSPCFLHAQSCLLSSIHRPPFHPGNSPSLPNNSPAPPIPESKGFTCPVFISQDLPDGSLDLETLQPLDFYLLITLSPHPAFFLHLCLPQKQAWALCSPLPVLSLQVVSLVPVMSKAMYVLVTSERVSSGQPTSLMATSEIWQPHRVQSELSVSPPEMCSSCQLPCLHNGAHILYCSSQKSTSHSQFFTIPCISSQPYPIIQQHL